MIRLKVLTGRAPDELEQAFDRWCKAFAAGSQVNVEQMQISDDGRTLALIYRFTPPAQKG